MNLAVTTKRQISIKPLTAPGTKQGSIRSIISFAGEYRNGIGQRIASRMNSLGATICSCSERYFQDSQAFGSTYIIEATPESMDAIERGSAEELDIDLESIEPASTTKYQLTFVAPDRQGILAIIGEMLLKRKIAVYSNDSVTFKAPLSEEMGGTGEETTIAAVNMLIGIDTLKHDEAFESLQDGLEYLEHRYHWYIRLERKKASKKKEATIKGISFDVSEGRFAFN